MKKLYILLIMAIVAIGASAQATQTVHGAVIDKNGNPLPGAEVFATGGAETTVTDADGTFTLEVPIWLKSITARYAGMDDKKLKTNFNGSMLFTMSPTLKNAWFLNLVGNVDIGYEGAYGRLGIMGGRLGKWGYYGKLLFPIGDLEEWATGIQGTVGAIKQVHKNIYVYLGGGYSGVQDESYYRYNYGYDNYSSWYAEEWHPGGAVEIGGIVRIGRRFNVCVGYLIAFDSSRTDHNVNFGIGYVF